MTKVGPLVETFKRKSDANSSLISYLSREPEVKIEFIDSGSIMKLRSERSVPLNRNGIMASSKVESNEYHLGEVAESRISAETFEVAKLRVPAIAA